MLKALLTTGYILLICNPPYSSFAQSAGNDQSTVRYERDFFVKYEPITLLDMLQRVPGVQAIIDKSRQGQGGGTSGGGKSERGFGSGGDQILINSKRLSGKANNISDTLARISAATVERVEIIRGASGDLDVQSQGLVVNVVMVDGASTSNTFWKIGGRYSEGYKLSPDLLVSHNGSRGNLEYILGASAKQGEHIEHRFDKDFSPDGNFISQAERRTDNVFKTLKFNGNIIYNLENNDEFRLNAQFEPAKYNKYEPRFREDLDQPREFQNWFEARTSQKWEIGGDYTANLEKIGIWKSLFIVNRDRFDKQTTYDNIFDSGDVPIFRNDEYRVKQEKIVRTSLTRNITSGQSLEIGAEAAFNNFSKKFTQEIYNLNAFDLSNNDDVAVKEKRYEIFANHTYNFSPKVIVQSSLIGEFSEISSVTVPLTGANIERSKNFKFLKPRIDFRYDLTSSDQIRASIERKVSQLDFQNFVAKYDVALDQIRLGNTGIVPEKSWNYSVTYEHRLPNDTGAIQLELFYRDITDYIGLVDFTEYFDGAGNATARGDLDFVSVSGNIPKAKAYGIKAVGNIRLGFMGLPEALFSVDYKWEKNDVIDQFSGNNRRFKWIPEHEVTFNYRHDITKWKMSYGFKGTLKSNSGRFEIDEVASTKHGGLYEIFAELKIFNDLKLILLFEHITPLKYTTNMKFYNDNIRFNELAYTSARDWKYVREYSLFLQGSF